MNIRQKIFYKNYKNRYNYLKSLNKSEIEKWINGRYDLSEEQLKFLTCDSRFTLGYYPRRSGKTFMLLLDAIYNSTQLNKKCLVITTSKIRCEDLVSHARQIALDLNTKINNDKLTICSCNNVDRNSRSIAINNCYIDEFCAFNSDIGNEIMPIISPSSSILKGASTPSLDYNWVIDIWYNEDATIFGGDK